MTRSVSMAPRVREALLPARRPYGSAAGKVSKVLNSTLRRGPALQPARRSPGPVGCGELEHVALAASCVPAGPGPDPAKLPYRPLRAMVRRVDDKDDPAHEAEGVVQHEPLHGAVVPPAPMGARQERPAYFDLILARIVPVET